MRRAQLVESRNDPAAARWEEIKRRITAASSVTSGPLAEISLGEACLAVTRGGWTGLDLIRRLELRRTRREHLSMYVSPLAHRARDPYLLTSFMLVLLSCPTIPS
jgi:hypothetical protein